MTTRNERLLVVDEERGECSDVANQLEALGYQVTCAHNTAHALNILNQRTFDLMLLDLDLKGTNAAQLVKRIKSNKQLKTMPIVVIAAEADANNISQCIQSGADDYLVAPFAPTLLQARVDIVIERQQLRQRAEEDESIVAKLAAELQQVILPVGIALSEESDFDRLLERILIEAKIVANADAGTLYLRTEEDTLEFAIVLTDSLGVALGGTTGYPIPFKPLPLHGPNGEPNLHNVASYSAHTGESVKVKDVYDTEDFDFSATKTFDEQNNYRTRSVLTVPLKNQVSTIGVLQLINSQDALTGEVSDFDYYEQLVIETLASQAAVALNNQMVFKRQMELLKLERDIQVGHSIQADFLPTSDELPQRAGWEIATCLHPARQVAGDFYDAFEMTHNRIGLLVADVCDKGVGAALFMALMRSLLRAFAQQPRHSLNLASILEETGESSVVQNVLEDLRSVSAIGSVALKEAVRMTNDYVAINHSQLGMFATMFFAVLNPDTGSVIYINGGHNAPIVVDSEGKVKQMITQTGPAVGMFANASFNIEEIILAPGDTLIAFTDGVPDARDPNGGFFTDARILELVSIPADSATELIERLESAVFAHIASADQFDDVTIMILQRCRAE